MIETNLIPSQTTMPNIAKKSQQLELSNEQPIDRLKLSRFEPFYSTRFGDAYLGDALDVLSQVPDKSVNLVLTSPPYALHFKKTYGNVDKSKYVEWFLPFAAQIKRILRDDGSFVLNIGGSYNPGSPTRSLYHFKLLVELVDRLGFYLAQECFWYNPAKLPVPAEWVTVRRVRVRDSVEYVWWLSTSENPKANNRRVLKSYSADMHRLNGKGLQRATRPSGHNIKESFSRVDSGGSIPPNIVEEPATDLLRFGNNAANDKYTLRCKEKGITVHPARFPAALPEFFIKLLTEAHDLVLDPFAGSNTMGSVAEKLERRWVAIDRVAEYLEASKFRFE